MKKAIAALSLSALMLAALPMTSFAHGHGGRGISACSNYPLCDVENCNAVREHRHDGITYAGHCIGDGHGSHSGHRSRIHQ